MGLGLGTRDDGRDDEMVMVAQVPSRSKVPSRAPAQLQQHLGQRAAGSN